MKKPFVTPVAVGIGLLAGHASAADLPWRGPPPPAPIYAPVGPPPFLWTGCYVGGNIGGAWADFKDSGATVSATTAGVSGGGQVGCDYQVAEWVFGVRNMLDATNLRSSTTLSPSGTANASASWFDTLTAREGYLIQPNVLAYVQGGAAWTNTHITFFNGAGVQVGEISNNRNGWTAGGGVEWMFAPHWSVFVEYNFMGFGSSNIQDAQAGVNYRF